MTEVVLDDSAVLAVLLGEAGADRVRGRLAGSLVSALNYSEVLARAARLCGSLAEAKRRVDRLDLNVVAFDAAQAAAAAALAPETRPLGLSLADQACLASGLTRGLPVWTADRAWCGVDLGVRIEFIR